MKNIKNKGKKLATQALALTMATSMISSAVPVYAISTTSTTEPILMKAAEPYQLTVVGKKLQIKPLNGKELRDTISVNNKPYAIRLNGDTYETEKNLVLFKRNDIGITAKDGTFKSIDFRYEKGLNYADGLSIQNPFKKIYGDELATREGIAIPLVYEYNVNFGKNGTLLYDVLTNNLKKVYMDGKEIPLRLKSSEDKTMPAFILVNTEYALIADAPVPQAFEILKEFEGQENHKVAFIFNDGSMTSYPEDYNPLGNEDNGENTDTIEDAEPTGIAQTYKFDYARVENSYSVEELRVNTIPELNLSDVQKIEIEGNEIPVSSFSKHWSGVVKTEVENLAFNIKNKDDLETIITFKDGSKLKHKSSLNSDEKENEELHDITAINAMAVSDVKLKGKPGEKITLYANSRPQNTTDDKEYSFKEWKLSKGNVEIKFDDDGEIIDGSKKADDAYFIMPSEDVIIEAIYNETEINKPNDPSETDDLKEKIAEKYKIDSAELTKEGFLNIYSTPNWDAKDMGGFKKLKVNEMEFENPPIYLTRGLKDAIQTMDKTIINQALKNQPTKMEITFKDNTTLAFEVNILKNNPFDVEAGTYTLGFKAYQKDTQEKSQMEDYLDSVVKYEITEDGKKIVTFAMDSQMSEMVKDFAIKGENDSQFISAEENIIDKRKEYKFEINGLDGKFDAAVMVKHPGSSAKESGKGNYDSDSYVKFDLLFNENIQEGFTGFKLGNELTREENDEILEKALIREGFDLNNDGKITPDELENGIGRSNEKAIWGDSFYGQVKKGLNLSGLKLTNIDMLKDLGANVDAINLEGNNIKNIPDNLFSKATGLKWLFMSGNDVEKIGSKAFEGAKELMYVDFDGNNIKEIPAGLFDTNTKLSEVAFPGNGLEVVPEGLFDNNEELSAVYLYYNNLKNLPDGLFNSQAWSTSFTHLDLYNNELESLPTSIGN